MSQDSPALLLNPDDNIAYVRRTIPAGLAVRVGNYDITAKEIVELGHKIALKPTRRKSPSGDTAASSDTRPKVLNPVSGSIGTTWSRENCNSTIRLARIFRPIRRRFSAVRFKAIVGLMAERRLAITSASSAR